MKRIVLFLSVLALFASCAPSDGLTHQERKAQRLLARAMRHDPNLVQKLPTDTLLKGVIYDTVHIETAPISGETDPFDCDSINMQLTRMLSQSNEQNAALYLYNDSLLSIAVKKDRKGNLSVKAQVKPQSFDKPVNVPYSIPVRIPGKVVTVYKKAAIWRYWGFWIPVALAALFVYLYIDERRRNRPAINVNLNKSDNGTSN